MNVKKLINRKSISRWAVAFALLGALLLSGTVFAEGEVPPVEAPAACARSKGKRLRKRQRRPQRSLRLPRKRLRLRRPWNHPRMKAPVVETPIVETPVEEAPVEEVPASGSAG